MTQLDGIGACVFDAYGTLFDVHSPVARVLGTMDDKAKALSQTWRDKQLDYTWLRSLMGAHADFWEVTGDALDVALETAGIDDAALRENLMQAYLTLDAYEDVPACLAALRAAGLKTAILSNGNPAMLEAAVGNAGIGDHFDAVWSVESVGIYKPADQVYRLATGGFSVSAKEICFVSTNSWDARAAAHFGMQVAWMNRFGAVPDRLPGTFAAVISGLGALPALVGAR